MRKCLADMEEGENGQIAELAGGRGFQTNLRTRGVREGKSLKVVARHPANGPVVLSIDGRETAIGRGMASRILVEVDEE